MRRWRLPLDRLRLDVLRSAVPVAETVPLLLVAALLPWLAISWRHWWKYKVLFHDVNMYQYGAWCMTHGQRIYQDISIPDGPLILLIHAALQLFVKTSEVGFRHADLLVHVLVALGTGALLAPLRRGPQRAVAIVVWAVTHAAIWLTFLFHPQWALNGQRENYYVLFGMGAVVLVYRAASVKSARLRTAMLVVGGAVAAAHMFGKHTGVAYVLLGALAVLPERGDDDARWWRMRRYALGVLAGTLSMVAFVAIFGSLRGFYFWYFRYDLLVYRYESLRPLESLLGEPGLAHYGRIAVVALAAGGAAVGLGLLPRRASAFVVAPALHYALAIAQSKGWQYQFMPSLASLYLLFTVALAHLWQGSSVEAATPWNPLRAAGATALVFVVGGQCLEFLQLSPWMNHPTDYSNPYEHAELKDIRDGAAALAKATGPSDRVFFYGADPVLPFLAERLPAVQYMTPWMVTFHPPAADTVDADVPRPDAARRAYIEQLQHQLQDDLCTHLMREPPKALAFVDGWEIAKEDYVATVTGYCPSLVPLMESRYRLDFHAGPVRIYVRK